MFGKNWDKFWGRFNFAMESLPDALNEAVDDGIPGCVVMSNKNGHIVIRGRISSLRINGWLVRVPEKVMESHRG